MADYEPVEVRTTWRALAAATAEIGEIPEKRSAESWDPRHVQVIGG